MTTEGIRGAMAAYDVHYGWELHEDACRVLADTAYPACDNMQASVPQGVLSLVVAGLAQIASPAGAALLVALQLAPARADARVAALAAFAADPHNVEGVSHAGGVRALLAVLRWRGASAHVCALACLALTSLAPHGENYACIRAHDGMQLVLRVFAQHRRELHLQTRALALLACLVAGSPGLKADFCLHGGHDTLWAALADRLGSENTRVAEAIVLECPAEGGLGGVLH